jgi:hypothetical protein
MTRQKFAAIEPFESLFSDISKVARLYELIDTNVRDLKEAVVIATLVLRFDPVAIFQAATRIAERTPLPSIWDAVDNFDVLVARKTQAHKPLAVNLSRWS